MTALRSLRAGLFERLETRRLFAAAKSLVWIEGEDAASTTFNRSLGWYATSGVDKSLLSPNPSASVASTSGNWLAHFISTPASPVDVRASYSFNVEQAGDYYFWIRLNPFSNQYSYRLDDPSGPFVALNNSDVAGSRNVLTGNALDIRFIGWKYVGLTDLSAGQHSLEMRLSGDGVATGSVHGAIDAIAFTNWNWGPTGPLKPALTDTPAAPDDWFSYAPGIDPFSATSVIDRSSLIESPAGLHGRVTRVDDKLAFADGAPAKFYGINALPEQTPAAMARQAKFYRKHGINLVRIHPLEEFLGDIEGPPEARTLNEAKLDRFDRWFAAMKSEGIYVSFSLFFNHVVRADEPGVDPVLYAELPARGAGKNVYGMATFVDEYQEAQWKYAQLVMNHQNPYTGLAYKDDPAVAHVETRNEDSVFWHTPLTTLFNNNGGVWTNHRNRLWSMFGTWVKNKYGTEEALTAAWGAARLFNDSWINGVFTVVGAYSMPSGGPVAPIFSNRARAGDQIQFLAEMQRADYERFNLRLRELGYEGMILTTGWMSGTGAGNAANLWTDDAGDMIDRHDYVGSNSSGGARIATGYSNSETGMATPGNGLLNYGLEAIEGKPFSVTEWASNHPGWYRAESAPLMAFYGQGLQGWDQTYHFTSRHGQLSSSWADLSTFSSENPLFMAQLPALSTSVLRSDIAEAGVAAARRISTASLYRGIDPLTQTSVGGGWNGVNGNVNVPHEVLAVGRVTNAIGEGLLPSQKIDWTQYWNSTAKTVTSMTGELYWDYANKFVNVRAPNQQAVVGFGGATTALPGGRSHSLPGATVTLQTPYASLLITSLDGLPITESDQVLVTALARDRQVGTTYNADGSQLLTLGLDALELEPVKATLAILGARAITEVRTLDAFGSPTDTFVPVSASNSFTIDGRYKSFYYLVSRTATPLSATPLQFENQTRQALSMSFSRDVAATIDAQDLVLLNTTSGETFDSAHVNLSYNGAENRATFTFDGLLPDGHYTAALAPGSVTDAGGVGPEGSSAVAFRVLAGDATGDGIVNFNDLLMLAKNYGESPRDFGRGDFNYDGAVGFPDLLALAKNYGKSLSGEVSAALARGSDASNVHRPVGQAVFSSRQTTIGATDPEEKSRISTDVLG